MDGWLVGCKDEIISTSSLKSNEITMRIIIFHEFQSKSRDLALKEIFIFNLRFVEIILSTSKYLFYL